MRRRARSMRYFDPERVGTLEARAWETYYRRKWGRFLLASVGPAAIPPTRSSQASARCSYARYAALLAAVHC